MHYSVTDPKTYTAGEAAALLGCSKNHIYALIARGELRGAIRLGRKVVISRQAIDEMLEPA